MTANVNCICTCSCVHINTLHLDKIGFNSNIFSFHTGSTSPNHKFPTHTCNIQITQHINKHTMLQTTCMLFVYFRTSATKIECLNCPGMVLGVSEGFFTDEVVLENDRDANSQYWSWDSGVIRRYQNNDYVLAVDFCKFTILSS